MVVVDSRHAFVCSNKYLNRLPTIADREVQAILNIAILVALLSQKTILFIYKPPLLGVCGKVGVYLYGVGHQL
jgi:hypothetical protein